MTQTRQMPPSQAPRVWDLPIRLFQWLLVMLFGLSWWSAETGHMDWHRLSGETIMGLVVFRIIWGIIGSDTARFSQFIRSPLRLIAYLRGQSDDTIGHNPIGGYSVILLLMLLGIQIKSGLFAVDTDGLESGPLSYLVSFEQGRESAHFHHFSFNILLLLVLVHILAIGFYRVVRKRKLIPPMITGRDAQLPAGTAEMAPAPWWRLALAVGIAAATAWYVGHGLRF
ncbi:MAG: hypothetical protein RLY97_529 [Pseudomonadota bacterium]